MRLSKLRLAAAVPIALVLIAGVPAHAFDIPDGQSCGGLVCDLGLFGHKTAPAAAAAVPASRAPAASLASRPSVEAERPAPDAARPGPAHRRIAKAVAPTARRAAPALEPSPAPVRTVAAVAPRRETRASPAISSATLHDFAPAGMAMEDTAPTLPALRSKPSEPIVLANPYVTDKPVPLAFDSVDPTVGAR